MTTRSRRWRSRRRAPCSLPDREAMSDFAQTGLICTLQRLNDAHLPRIEAELVELARDRPIALVLPCHAADLERPAFGAILRELDSATFVREVVLSINGIDGIEFGRRYGDRFNLAVAGGEFTTIFNRGAGGKGENVESAFAHLVEKSECEIIATQDCDVASFRRADLARLCYAVAHPQLGFRFAKMYYSRVTDRLYGRVSRLFLAPLLHAVVHVAGHLPLVDFLLSFRYPLAGEVAMTRELAASLRRSAGWGLEIGQLCEVFRHVDPREVCQVDGGSGYDHKHQPATTALAAMASEIARELLAQLAAEGLSKDDAFRAALARAYRQEAAHALRRSASLALINGLPFDEPAERGIVECFADRLDAL
jgi:glucosyl-3-phosphoglycerate synthase